MSAKVHPLRHLLTLGCQTVLARVKSDGSFDSVGGRVEIRYKPNDPRAYRASERNLERIVGEPILADDACVPGEEVSKPTKEERSSVRKAEAAAKVLSPAAVPKDAWTVYVDGACSGNPGPAGLGIVLVASGVGVYSGNILARTVGVFVAGASMLSVFLWLPWYPFWGFVILFVDISVIWALTVHGRDYSKL